MKNFDLKKDSLSSLNEALQAQQRGKVRFVGDAPTGSEQVAQGFSDQIVGRQIEPAEQGSKRWPSITLLHATHNCVTKDV